MSWYEATHDFCYRARSHGIKVYEYTFDQHQSCSSSFKGTGGHSLDLAYMHDDPAIFTAITTAGQEMMAQKQLLRDWILFANGRGP